MRNCRRILTFCIIFICLVSKTGQSCTTFCLNHGDKPVFGKNHDWMLEYGLVIINKRGVTKTARPGLQDKLLTWTSKYGSATFNQFGREFPFGGMNEVGLVVESMLLNETEYPLPDSRPAINILQWIQYQLDNFSTIEEVITSDSQIRIRGSEEVIANDSQIRIRGYRVPGCHFLVCDRTGNCATIEFIGHKLVYHTTKKMPVKTLTNSTYAESISFWKKDKIPQPDVYKSIERFIRAANMVKNYDPQMTKTPIDYAFNILSSVAQAAFTQWSIVYDIADPSIYFRTLENQRVRYFSLKSFDFSCAAPVKVLDVNADLSGDITAKFVDYTYQINRNLVRDAFRETYFLSHLPAHALDKHSTYPESTRCIE